MQVSLPHHIALVCLHHVAQGCCLKGLVGIDECEKAAVRFLCPYMPSRLKSQGLIQHNCCTSKLAVM